ncbi:hypothetical protein Afil01_24770 [Actinorhabdospora filicis]|uniref:VWFA domain-containing protein n=1 Tax=Actinorhabdospora filicis TaxID=1785913 RepID=A0A9W6SKN9_9ACTN|nr:von Willebrand factor type A domain-containing protein [Actinorhabdospora filicis]GLZ77670.1 hypothetical protein Afil01_24770 [Actinorhabdospora filicis]
MRIRYAAALSVLFLAACSGPGGGADSGRPATAPESTKDDALSTFALDVDTASYDFAARTLDGGALPDRATIRPEEFVNAFRQDYPRPTGEGVAVTADGSRAPSWYGAAKDARILRVGVATRDKPAGDRAPVALTFVVDTSGSMAEPGRLDLVKDALHYLVDRLGPDDSVGLVSYSTRADVLREMTPVSSRGKLHDAIDELEIDGSTNLEDGLVTGYEVAREGFREGAANRVILLSDGLANTGSTESADILEQTKEQAGKGIALLCVGVGSEYGDALMEQLADKGDGFAVYVAEQEKARRLFAERLTQTLLVAARDAKAQVAFDEATVKSYRLIGFENRALADDDFRDDAADGGELGPGHTVTALYEVVLRPEASGPVATATVRWNSPSGGAAQEVAASIATGDLDGEWGAATLRARVDLLAGSFARVLRGDEETREWLPALEEEAAALAKATDDGEVVRLAGLIGRARELS